MGNKKNGSGLFLMEMIMAVGFFMIAASICILVFVKSNQMSRLAKETNQSVICAESIGEVLKELGTEGLTEQFGAVNHETKPGTYLIFLDKTFTKTSKDQADYYVNVTVDETSEILSAGISVCSFQNNEELYVLEVKKYQRP